MPIAELIRPILVPLVDLENLRAVCHPVVPDDFGVGGIHCRGDQTVLGAGDLSLNRSRSIELVV